MELNGRPALILVSCWILLIALVHPSFCEGPDASDTGSDLDIVDLSMPLKNNDTKTWPSFPHGFESERLMYSENPDGFVVQAYGLKMPIHSGTHVDAPCHVTGVPDNLRINQVPMNRFFGPGAVIDLSGKVAVNRDHQLSLEDITAWEKEHGRLPDGAIVLIHTGWSERYAEDADTYFGGTDHATGENLWSFPAITAGVGRFLVEERNINALGLDSPSPDSGRAVATFPVHREILDRQRLIIENIGSTLGQLPPTGYTIHAVPLALQDTCGAPVRLLAFRDSGAWASPTSKRGSAGGEGSTATILLNALLKIAGLV